MEALTYEPSSPLLPTPTAWLGRRPVHAQGSSDRWMDLDRSNELSDFLAWLGASTSPPSDATNTSSADPTRTPPTSEER